MKKKREKYKILLLYTLLILLCIFLFGNITNAIITTYFNNSLTNENISFIGNQNFTRYLDIYYNASVTSATLNLSGYRFYNLSSTFYTGEFFSLSSQTSEPRGLFINSSGTTMIIFDDTSNTILQYSLSSPWNISTASYTGNNFSINSQDTAPRGLFFNGTGNLMYIIGDSSNGIHEYIMAINWNIS
ncbi:MAG: hypothetical protein AABY22_04580, partial [Nanoarchaeota archaeon]